MFEATDIPGVVLVKPRVHSDDRGFFVETYHEPRYRENGIPDRFVQDNHSRSAQNTLRGLHAQLDPEQGKLVRAVEGEIFDVAVDIRVGSPTFRNWVGVALSADNFRQLWVPPGFAHGFCVTSPVAQVEYKCTELYDPEREIEIAWNDPQIGITWPTLEPLLSTKDAAAPRLAEITQLPRFDPPPRNEA